jgi:hypothetical protein
MADSWGEFRQAYLPYALMRLADGSYLPVNREYKPLGVTSKAFVKYDELSLGRVKVTAAAARKLCVRGVGDLTAESIYLYNDGCVPTSSAQAWAQYAARLAVLSKAKVAASA